MNWLLAFVPLTVWLEHAQPEAHTAIFTAACLAVLPLASWMGRATEHLSARTGEGVGGLLNATFGNAAELIIAIAAMRQGMYDVVKASLTGSIIGNILLVLGAAFLAGGLKFPKQEFNAVAARSQATMLTLAAIALVVPAAFHYLAGPEALTKLQLLGAGGVSREAGLSLEIALVLLLTYVCGLVFSLRTHHHLFMGSADPGAAHEHVWSRARSVATLAVATAFVAWMSEILVGSVNQTAESLGMTSVFVGVIVVAVIGNAAEHSTAILVARKNRMDLSLGIAIGASTQVALFVAPILVLLSLAIGPRPMDLVFTPAEVVATGVAILICEQVASDGESNWFEGVQLLAVYVILGIMFFFLPEARP
jgi:Ca2+:H+ antiporter